MAWLLLTYSVSLLVCAVVLAVTLAFVRVSRELAADEYVDQYF